MVDVSTAVASPEIEPWIERIGRGEPNVLTTEPVLMMEKTSGSSGAAKYIPYTRSLRREFQHIGFLTPIEIEHSILVAGKDQAAN